MLDGLKIKKAENASTSTEKADTEPKTLIISKENQEKLQLIKKKPVPNPLFSLLIFIPG